MNSTEKLFVNILGNYINDKPINHELLKEYDEDRLKELVKIHKVISITHTVLKKCAVDKNLIDKMEMGLLSEMAFHQKKIRVLGKLKEILSDNEIDYICVKGSQIYLMYPNPEFRTMGDLDILIREEDMTKMKELFLQNGLKFIPENSFDNVWNFKARGTEVEMHSNLVSEGRLMNGFDYKKFFEDAFEHKIQVENHLYKLETEYNLSYLIFHIAKHFYNSGCGVRMLLDLPAFVKSENINWEILWSILEEIQLLEFSIKLFNICEKWFGDFGVKYPPNCIKVNEDYSMVEDFIICGGIYGFYNRNTDADSIKIKINENGGKGGYIKGIWLWAFPSYKRMREYSVWFKDKPAILLPIAYLERFVRNSKERGGIVRWFMNVIKGRNDLIEKEQILHLMNIK